ncbi:MAG: ABC transporter permease [Nanoarchaeota archaeon]|nr:ABC transporter permease [Nanoarchaeota archaeon]
MKVFSIFKKDMKTVSRSPSYFVLLFIVPVLLIVAGGAMLNSVDFSNVKLGIVDNDPNYDFNLRGVHNHQYFDSLSDCIFDLTSYKVSACLVVSPIDNSHQIDIYLDNSKRVIEYFAKQLILEKVMSEQSFVLQQTSDEIDSRISLYSTSISNARVELINVRNDLEQQEQDLLDYKTELGQTRSDFDEVYYPLKNSEPELIELRDRMKENNDNLENNITLFRQRKQEIDTSIAVLRVFLSTRLNAGDYNYVNGQFTIIENNLNDIDNVLTSVEQMQSDYEQVIELLDNMELMIQRLDQIKDTLDRLDSDLDNSIQRTRQSQVRVDGFIVELDRATGELSSFSQDVGGDASVLNFNNAYDLSDDPVFMVFPFLISIIITFTTMVLSNMFILKLVNKNSYLRDIISPARDANFIIAHYLVNLFFISIQAFVLFLIGIFYFNMPSSLVGSYSLIIFLAASIYIFIGMSLGYLVRSQSLSMLLTLFFVMLMFIFSDVLLPTSLAGPIVRFFAELNPFVLLNNLLRDVLLLERSFGFFDPRLIRLWVVMFVTLIICYISKKVSKEDVMS